MRGLCDSSKNQPLHNLVCVSQRFANENPTEKYVFVDLEEYIIYNLVRYLNLENFSQNQTVETCYEEVPAVPQPAYVFSGLSPDDLRHAVLIESLPGYQHDDPYKTDCPPPTYDQSFHAERDGNSGQGASSSRQGALDELVESIETTDTAFLMDNQEDQDDYICLQQMSS